MAKALGRGFLEGPHSVRILALDPVTGIVTATPQGRLADAVPQVAGAEFLAYTARDGDYVVASTTCEGAT